MPGPLGIKHLHKQSPDTNGNYAESLHGLVCFRPCADFFCILALFVWVPFMPGPQGINDSQRNLPNRAQNRYNLATEGPVHKESTRTRPRAQGIHTNKAQKKNEPKTEEIYPNKAETLKESTQTNRRHSGNLHREGPETVWIYAGEAQTQKTNLHQQAPTHDKFAQTGPQAKEIHKRPRHKIIQPESAQTQKTPTQTRQQGPDTQGINTNKAPK